MENESTNKDKNMKLAVPPNIPYLRRTWVIDKTPNILSYLYITDISPFSLLD